VFSLVQWWQYIAIVGKSKVRRSAYCPAPGYYPSPKRFLGVALKTPFYILPAYPMARAGAGVLVVLKKLRQHIHVTQIP
jgi:hypothetical protein